MKTNLLSALLLFLFVPALKAQVSFKFADSTAQWNLVGWDYISGPIHTRMHTVSYDTIIQGESFQKIGPAFFTMDSMQKVYLHNAYNSSTNLIYDFGKQRGDTVKLYDNFYAVVDSVDSVTIGISRKALFVSYYDSLCTLGKDVWVFGIGALHSGPFYLPMPCMWEVPPTYLLCYFEKEQLLFHNSNFASCNENAPLASYILQNLKYVRVFPNPVSDQVITIQSETSFPVQTTFHLFDVTGRMVLEKHLYDKVPRIELDGINKGLYLYSINSAGQKISSGKLAVQ